MMSSGAIMSMLPAFDQREVLRVSLSEVLRQSRSDIAECHGQEVAVQIQGR